MVLKSPGIATVGAAAIAILHAGNGLAHRAMHCLAKAEIGCIRAANMRSMHQDSLSFARV